MTRFWEYDASPRNGNRAFEASILAMIKARSSFRTVRCRSRVTALPKRPTKDADQSLLGSGNVPRYENKPNDSLR